MITNPLTEMLVGVAILMLMLISLEEFLPLVKSWESEAGWLAPAVHLLPVTMLLLNLGAYMWLIVGGLVRALSSPQARRKE